ncbi:MAG: hypothetical protein JSV63_01820 [Candidatus Aenigmatarchaeota archaeon]|nr:MAG: hypothetical protein JSV63_01820 [Candidatus Aenigmarchaeota archaeon]
MPWIGKSVSENDAVYGFLSGILILGALFVWLFTEVVWVIPVSLFAMGILIIFDTAFPYGKQLFAISWMGGLIAGSFALLFANAFGFLYWILAAAALAFVLIIAEKLFRRMSK